MRRLLLYIIPVWCFLSCHRHSKPLAAPTSETIPQRVDTTFFPVTSFLKGEIAQFDSLQVTPLHLITINGKTDSIWDKIAALKSFVKPFLEPVISEKNMVPYFIETKFNDLTVGAITFSYQPKKEIPDSIGLLNWDIYINPEKSRVIRIYIVKSIQENNQSITEQLTWENGKSAQIVSILNNPDGSSRLLRQEKFIWDF